MSLIPLSVTVAGKILASHVNDLLSAFRLQLVGRNSSGAPKAGQDLGTETYPWGDIHGNHLFTDDITIDGRPVVKEKVQRSRNGIISGRTRTTSGQPDFIRASGSSLQFTILATSTPLKLVINDEIVEITSDIVVTVPTAGSLSTQFIEDSTLSGQDFTKTLGEDGSIIQMGPTAATYYNDVFAFKNTVTSEMWIGFFYDADVGTHDTVSSSCFRGWFFDSSGSPIDRDVLNDGNQVKLLKIYWIFIQNNGTTVESVEQTPIYSDTQPTVDLRGVAVADGQYWFDLTLQTWKRYNGSTWEILNRLLIGHVVVDPDVGPYVTASRSFDFDNEFEETNNLTFEKLSTTQITTNKPLGIVSVYGETIKTPFNNIIWTMPTDLDTGTEQNKLYYVYIGEDGSKNLSLEKPHNRTDLLGWYHPFNNWRCVGYVDNSTGDFEQSNHQLDKGIYQGDADGQTILLANIDNIEFGRNTFIDNKQRWDPTNHFYRTNENEIYRVSVRIGIISVVGFTGSSNDEVFQFWISLDNQQDIGNYAGWSMDWINTAKGIVYDDTTLNDNFCEISYIVQGKKNNVLYVKGNAINCTSVGLGRHCTISINQIN